MSWIVGKLEEKTVYLESKQLDEKGKPRVIPITICRLPLIPITKAGIPDTENTWWIVQHRGKFGIRFPDSKVDIDKRGYHRPNGQRIVQNRDSGLDASTLMQRLYDKFPKPFVRQIVTALNA